MEILSKEEALQKCREGARVRNDRFNPDTNSYVYYNNNTGMFMVRYGYAINDEELKGLGDTEEWWVTE
jgi:hypothetical protein